MNLFGKVINEKLKEAFLQNGKQLDTNEYHHIDYRNRNLNENVILILQVAVGEPNKIYAKYLIDTIEKDIRSKLNRIKDYERCPQELLLISAQSGDLDIAEHLLRNGIDANSSIDDYPYLNLAYRDQVCKKNGLPKLLLEYWASPNNQDKHGKTVIHHATVDGDTEFLKLFIPKIACFSIRDRGQKQLFNIIQSQTEESMKPTCF